MYRHLINSTVLKTNIHTHYWSHLQHWFPRGSTRQIYTIVRWLPERKKQTVIVLQKKIPVSTPPKFSVHSSWDIKLILLMNTKISVWTPLCLFFNCLHNRPHQIHGFIAGDLVKCSVYSEGCFFWWVVVEHQHPLILSCTCDTIGDITECNVTKNETYSRVNWIFKYLFSQFLSDLQYCIYITPFMYLTKEPHFSLIVNNISTQAAVEAITVQIEYDLKLTNPQTHFQLLQEQKYVEFWWMNKGEDISRTNLMTNIGFFLFIKTPHHPAPLH